MGEQVVVVPPKEMTRRYLEAFASGDVAAFDHIFHPDVDFSAPGLVTRDLTAVKAWHRRLPDAFPDLDTRVIQQITTPAIAVTELALHGTHDGLLQAFDGSVVAPTRRPVSLRAWMSLRVDGDLATSCHVLFDQLELLGQLGLAPVQVAS